MREWNILDGDAAILWREYRFRGKATATTLVFRGPDGLVVVSPACGLEDRDYDALKEHGEVRALVANNAFHTLGLKPWAARFPNALLYCPSGAITSLEKKTGATLHPLTDLKLSAGMTVETPLGFKTGETLVSIPSRKGTVWYTGDLLTNMKGLPGPPLRWLFTWTGSAPGFRLFRPAVWLMVKDKAALRADMLERLSKDPPAVVVPAHGPPVEGTDLAEQARSQLERL